MKGNDREATNDTDHASDYRNHPLVKMAYRLDRLEQLERAVGALILSPGGSQCPHGQCSRTGHIGCDRCLTEVRRVLKELEWNTGPWWSTLRGGFRSCRPESGRDTI